MISDNAAEFTSDTYTKIYIYYIQTLLCLTDEYSINI